MKRFGYLEQFAHFFTQWTGTTWAFFIALMVVVIWLITGPYFEFSDTWQLVINTGTTIITFLMVFLIQRTMNKEMQAVQLKLNELIAALEGASNRLINVEDLSEDEVRRLHCKYRKLAMKSLIDERRTISHSIEEEDDD
jgi:low affinity Fe/Cu permease